MAWNSLSKNWGYFYVIESARHFVSKKISFPYRKFLVFNELVNKKSSHFKIKTKSQIVDVYSDYISKQHTYIFSCKMLTKLVTKFFFFF